MNPVLPGPPEIAAVSSGGAGRWRSVLSACLIFLGCLLAMLSLLSVWLNSRVANTEAYVETVAPLAEDQAIQRAVAARLTDELFTRLDVAGRIQQALPDEIDVLAVPATAELKDFTQRETERLFASERFRKLWEEANRHAHQELRALALGKTRHGVSVNEGRVILGLEDFSDWQLGYLKSLGIEAFTFDGADASSGGEGLVIFESSSIISLQSSIDRLNRLANWLPPLALITLLGGLIAARDRYRAAVGTGFGLSLAASSLLISLAAARRYYLGSISEADPEAAARFFDIVFDSLRTAGRGMFAVGVIIAAGAYIVSLTRPLKRLKGIVDEQLLPRLPFDAGSWVFSHRRGLQMAGVITALGILVWQDIPSLARLLLLAAALLAYLALIRLLAKPPSGHQ